MKDELSQHVQDCFVHLCASDDKFLGLVRPLIPTKYLGSIVTEKLVQLCYNYYDQFKQAPKHHLHDELQRFLQTQPKDEKILYVEYFKKIAELQVSNSDYVLKRINEFIKIRKFEEAAVDFAELLDQNKVDEGKNLMYNALRDDASFDDPGISLLEEKTPTYHSELYDQREFLFKTGIEHLDSILGGIKRGIFIVVFGPMKGGKSWLLIHLGKQALLRGLNVLHLTHELKLDETEMRYDMSFSGSVKERKPTEVEFVHKILRNRTRGGPILVDERTETREVDTIFNLARVRKSRRTMKRFGGRLVIKKYPMGTCSIQEVERYLNYLEIFENFIPDVLIQDYIDIMKLPGSNLEVTRNKLNDAYIQHKRIVDERNITIITASQIPRSSINKMILGKTDFAEDIRKIANTDLSLGIGGSPEQIRRDIVSVWIMANRSGPEGKGCYVQHNYKIGRFCVESFPATLSFDDEEEDASEN